MFVLFPGWLLGRVTNQGQPLTWGKSLKIGYPLKLKDPSSSCPRSLLKTTPPPPGYPWVSRGWYVTPEPRFSGLVLDHQGLEELELKNHTKTAVFDQIWLFLNDYFSGSFKTWWSSTKALNLGCGITYRPTDAHGYPGGGGVVFSNGPGQLRVGSVSVRR